jgi:predicted anti-sigma-YlaC factor YlaD
MTTGSSIEYRENLGGMDCGTAREALSALLDGEALPCTQRELDAHLADCHECRQWRETAHLVTRHARLTPAASGLDSTERILAAVLADRPYGERRRSVRLVRVALAATAFAHAVIIVPALAGRAGPGVSLQAARELAAFNLTLAVALLAAAVRPVWARPMLPVVGVAAGFLTVIDLWDTANGYTTLRAEAPHLVTVLGAVLLALLAARASGGGTDGPARRPQRRQALLRALRPRRLLPDVAGFVRLPLLKGAWHAEHGLVRGRLRGAPADEGLAHDGRGDDLRGGDLLRENLLGDDLLGDGLLRNEGGPRRRIA